MFELEGSSIYLNAYYDREDQRIHIWDDGPRGHYSFPYKPYAYVKSKSTVGTIFSIYGDPLKRVQRWSKEDEEKGNVFESDIPVLTRCLIDEYMKSDEVSDKHRELVFDIEVSSEGGFPNITTADNVIYAIGWYDKANKQQGVYVLDRTITYTDTAADDGTIVRFFQTEEELLGAFLLKWTEIAPTIITGWNIEGFDVPYLYHRVRNVLGVDIANQLSPIGVVKWNEYAAQYKIAGVSILDYLALYKKFTYTQEATYNLDAIGLKEVDMGKVKYEGSLDNLFETDLKKFIEYNLCDVIIVRKIDEKMRLLDLVKSTCHKAHVPYEDIYYSSRVIDGAILTYLKRLGIVAPNKKFRSMDDATEEGIESFSGAYVKEPNVGRYYWIYDLDMTSLYPSVIMTLNISPEMKIGKIENWGVDEYVAGKSKTLDIDFVDKHTRRISTDDFKDYLEQHQYAVAVNGVLYTTKTAGLIPTILNDWFKERVEYKTLMKKFGDAKNKEMFEYYKQLQHVMKILLNSVYGVLGLPTFRFYDADNAEAVTTTGVKLIKFAEKVANHWYDTELQSQCIFITFDDGTTRSYDTTAQIRVSRSGVTKTIYAKDIEMTDDFLS